MRIAFVTVVLLAQLFLGTLVSAQPQEVLGPAPSESPAPVVLPPAGIVPEAISLDIIGAPVADPQFLYVQIRDALDRQIRPTLRPNAGIRYGTFNPRFLQPLASGTSTVVNVTVTIVGDLLTSTVTGTTAVTLNGVVIPPAPPTVLFLSDDPEYLRGDGLIFRGEVSTRPTRLYYYHSNVGLPRSVDVVLTAATPSRVHLVQAHAGPDPDVLSVGHSVSRDYLVYQQANAGMVVDIVPGKPFIVRHGLLQGEVLAGAVDMHVLEGGPIVVSVVGASAGSRPETYLEGPQQPYDGHNRHGTFNLDGFGALEATYTAGGPDVAVQFGLRTPTPPNVNPDDGGRDFGDYGVMRRITFTLVNPTDDTKVVYFYKRPVGGPVRSSFLVDGELKEIGCARLPGDAWRDDVSFHHIQTMDPDSHDDHGRACYPLEFGPSICVAEDKTGRLATVVLPGQRLQRHQSPTKIYGAETGR